LQQESYGKDVDRDFGVLQARITVARYPDLTWSQEEVWKVMNYGVILNNMSIDCERKNPPIDDHPYDGKGPLS
jgi:hypothetical protein